MDLVDFADSEQDLEVVIVDLVEIPLVEVAGSLGEVDDAVSAHSPNLSTFDLFQNIVYSFRLSNVVFPSNI